MLSMRGPHGPGMLSGVASGVADTSGTWGTSGGGVASGTAGTSGIEVASTARGASIPASGIGVVSTRAGTSRALARSDEVAASPELVLASATALPASTPTPPLPPAPVEPPLPPVAIKASGDLLVLPPLPAAPASDTAGFPTAPSANGRSWLASKEHAAASAAMRRRPRRSGRADKKENVFMVSTSRPR